MPVPVASRTLDGPSNGKTKYGPEGTPQRPKVWPKSKRVRGMPISVATSITPPSPIKVFTPTRNRFSTASWGRSCSAALVADQTSRMLLKKLPTPRRTGSGVTWV